MADKKLINKIKRQNARVYNKVKDMAEYDKIVNMEWDGIPNLCNEEYYVEYIDTTGRDIIQQATNVYAVQRPKWDVLPRGIGDAEKAEEFERVIEWYFHKAAQYGPKPYSTEVMTHIGKYNMAVSQLEWFDNYFCIKNYHPGTIRYEMGSKLHWVAEVNNVWAMDILEQWSDYAKPGWWDKVTRGDSIGSALKKIQEMVDEDPEQRMMYVDYTDAKRRYTYCYPVSDQSFDDDLGYDDDGKEAKDLIVIQDKENTSGFINWAITENEGDPLLAPLLKGRYYDNINDLETMKATNLFRRGLVPMFIQQGREDADPEIDYSGGQIVIKTPTGAVLIPHAPQPLDPGYDAMAAQMRQRMNQSLSVTNVSQAQVSNVQHSTYDAQIRMWLMQFEPNKRTAEKHFEQLAKLMFMHAKKKEKILRAMRMNSKPGMARGSEIDISHKDINLDALYIKCRILANNPTDIMQLTNQIVSMKQAGIRVPDKEYIEQFDMGDPDMLAEEYEKQEIRSAALQAKLALIIKKADNELQKDLLMFQAQLQASMAGGAPGVGTPAGGPPGMVPPEQPGGLPTDEMTTGMGFDAGMGGMPPQAAVPGITQAMRQT